MSEQPFFIFNFGGINDDPRGLESSFTSWSELSSL